MKWSKILVYLIILVVLAAYAYFFEFKKQKEKLAAEKKAAELVHIARDQVSHILIKSKEHGAIELKKPAGLWTVIRPVTTKADDAATTSWLRSITAAQREGVVAEKDVKWSEYGFDDPALVAEIVSKDKSAKITFGVKNPAGTSYYARVDQDPKLLLVQDTLKNSLDKNAFDLRDKTVVAIAGQDVERISYSDKDRGIELKKEASGWKMVKPEAMRVKREVIDKDILRLTNMRAKDIIDQPETADDPYGLKEPVRKIVLAGTKLDQTLLIGKSVEDKGAAAGSKKVYARVEGRKPVYVVDDWVLTKVVVDPEKLRDRSLFSFDPQNIVQAAIDMDGKEWQAARDKDKKWSLKKPTQIDNIDTWKVTSVLWDIKDLGWKDRKKPTKDRSEFGLDKPRLTALLTVKGENRPIVLKAAWTDPPASAEKKPEDKEVTPEPQKQSDQKEKAATPATPAKTTKPSIEAPKTVYAMVSPSEDESFVLVLDGKFLSGLRMDLDRLSEPEKSKKK